MRLVSGAAGRGSGRERHERGAGDPVERLAVAEDDLEVRDRDPGVLPGQALGAGALAALDRLDQTT